MIYIYISAEPKVKIFMLSVPRNVIQLCNSESKTRFSNESFNTILLVFYMFRSFYVHRQQDLIIHAVLYGMVVMYLCKQSDRLEDVPHTKV